MNKTYMVININKTKDGKLSHGFKIGALVENKLGNWYEQIHNKNRAMQLLEENELREVHI